MLLQDGIEQVKWGFLGDVADALQDVPRKGEMEQLHRRLRGLHDSLQRELAAVDQDEMLSEKGREARKQSVVASKKREAQQALQELKGLLEAGESRRCEAFPSLKPADPVAFLEEQEMRSMLLAMGDEARGRIFFKIHETPEMLRAVLNGNALFWEQLQLNPAALEKLEAQYYEITVQPELRQEVEGIQHNEALLKMAATNALHQFDVAAGEEVKDLGYPSPNVADARLARGLE